MSKEKINYYDEFIKNTDYALKSAEILDDYFENFEEEKAQEKEDVIHELENKADDSLHEIVKSLTKDFIPPLDRDDILEIGNYIDDMNDCIYDVIKNINMYNILHLREDAQDFSNLILQTCDRLKDLLTMFKSNGKITDIQDLIIEINRIEGLGDELYQKSMKSLMTDENNPIIIIKWVNLYSSLEDCLDQGEVIANCIEKNIIKRG